MRDAILLGILLTAAVLAVFLTDRRAGLLAALSLPVTLSRRFGSMKLLGLTLNLMTLGGLAVAIGLVIDDAIVVVEAISAHREAGRAALRRRSRAGLSEVTAPVIGTTLTTVVVFVPLAFLEGIVGRFFAALAVTLSAAVLLSLLFALLVLPVLGTRLLSEAPPTAGERRRSFARASATATAGLLRRLVHHRWAAVAVGLALVVAGGLALSRAPTGLPSRVRRGGVRPRLLPAGRDVARRDRRRGAAKIGAVLSATPGVATWSRRTGAELGPITATQFNRGDVTVLLKPRGERTDVRGAPPGPAPAPRRRGPRGPRRVHPAHRGRPLGPLGRAPPDRDPDRRRQAGRP